jgi:hypothetical protein
MSSPSKTCRNCGGTEFYEGDSARTVAIAITPFSLPPKFHLQICGTCGILDWFLPENDLKKFRKKFSRKKA